MVARQPAEQAGAEAEHRKFIQFYKTERNGANGAEKYINGRENI